MNPKWRIVVSGGDTTEEGHTARFKGNNNILFLRLVKYIFHTLYNNIPYNGIYIVWYIWHLYFKTTKRQYDLQKIRIVIQNVNSSNTRNEKISFLELLLTIKLIFKNSKQNPRLRQLQVVFHKKVLTCQAFSVMYTEIHCSLQCCLATQCWKCVPWPYGSKEQI